LYMLSIANEIYPLIFCCICLVCEYKHVFIQQELTTFLQQNLSDKSLMIRELVTYSRLGFVKKLFLKC